MKKTTGDALQDLKVRPSCSYYLLSGILSSFVWDLDIMQLQLRGLHHLLKCQNVFSELRLTDTIYICNLAFVNRSVNMSTVNGWRRSELPAIKPSQWVHQ